MELPNRPLERVWGIGMPRTGTSSLHAAVRMLGYARVAHNPSFAELPHLDAGTDGGCAVFYRYLHLRWPESRFVLTIRDVDTWLASVEFLMKRFELREGKPGFEPVMLRRSLLWGRLDFEPVSMRRAYWTHYEAVRKFFAEKGQPVLELNVCGGEGWEKLCPFLGRPMPRVPFPKVNSVDAVRRYSVSRVCVEPGNV